ncbi:MAG TPA: ABC transporter permease [Gaiellaceae bacterium]|nr:ABC transporter permease [Gaiellaceae bacterium]
MTDREPRHGMVQSTVQPGAVGGVPDPSVAPISSEAELAYEAGVELKARSQWSYARIRFFRHKMAVISLAVLIFFAIVAIFAKQLAPYGFDEIDLTNPDPTTGLAKSPRLDDWHIFGTDQLGRDYLSRIIYGIRTSLWVAVFVALLATAIGTAIGAIAGFYGGQVDNLLMRLTDLFFTVPGLAILLVAAVYLGSDDSEITQISLPFTDASISLPFTIPIYQPMKIGIILAFLFWVALARVVRGLFLSLREKEFVEAAKAAGASDMRIIIRHILPNCIGPIVVFTTLIVAGAILTEAFLSFVGYGIQPPNAALGKLIVDGQSEGFTLWWLVVFPGLAIFLIAMCINFVGDGLRDALDPTQRRSR